VGTTLFYPVFLALVALIVLIIIPGKLRKEYFIYGLIIGALGDVIAVAVFQNVLHFIWFKNLGIFNVMGQMVLSPLCWLFTVMLFLYFLPNRRWFLYTYVAIWAMASVAFGYMVHNVRLFDFKSWFYPIPAYFTFLGWWVFATWFFKRNNNLTGASDD
jgi:hypothetical protein